MAKPCDTSPEAESVLIEVDRRMTPGQKWLLLGQMYADARALHADGVRFRFPGATPDDIRVDWLRTQLGLDIADLLTHARQESGA
jgi:hypothetical protein